MTFHQVGAYDSPLDAGSVDGRALDLLKRHAHAPQPGEIHLDIGCGHGRMAEKIQSELGRVYVGVDIGGDGLASLAERGFEAHQVLLDGRAESFGALQDIVKDRSVASITCLDTLAHIVDSDAIFQAIGDLARKHLAMVVVSAPNVTHRDIGAKLVFGGWNYTAAGLLNRTHVRLFDESMLLAALKKAGLLVVERNDVVLSASDQCFPSTHPALSAGTPLNGLLLDAARQANPSAEVNQFVCLCAPAREVECETFTTVREAPRPLVSAVIRTQGRRPHTLVEALTCLSAQTDADFEAIVVGHKLDVEGAAAVERAIEDTPEWLRRKTRLIRVEDGGRSRPLNVGFAAARGRYIAILDDDDAPLANWIEEFRKLDARSPGSVLRATCVRQDVKNVWVGGRAGLRAEGSPERFYPNKYNFLDHFVENASPPISLAFPHGAFHCLGLRFDETLDTTEDWDFLLRVSAYCGVVSSTTISSIYRWWLDHESSRTAHDEDVWKANHKTILRKQDQGHFIIPKGGLAHIRRLVRHASPDPDSGRKFVHALASTEDGLYWSHHLDAVLPKDLSRALRKGLQMKCAFLKFKYWLMIFSARRRRKTRAKLRIYQAVLRNHS